MNPRKREMESGKMVDLNNGYVRIPNWLICGLKIRCEVLEILNLMEGGFFPSKEAQIAATT